MTNDLRSRAERRVREAGADRSRDARPLSPEEARLLHDLQVHQIELEMQNDELRRTESELEASRARYFNLYDVAPVGYLTISEGGAILEANLTAATLLRATRGALVNRQLTAFLAPEDQDNYYLHRKRLFGTGVPQVLDIRLRREDGTQFWARIEATTAQDADGTEVCRAVVSDVTDRKRIEEERLRFEREIQQTQKAESLTRMAGAIAHHFNNQLAVVMSNLELSMGEPALSGTCLADALIATRKAAEVSGLLLTYLGQSSGNHAPLDLSEECRRSLPMLTAAMPKHVEFDTALPSPGPPVNGNPNQLMLMLTNLVTNAWEAAGDLPAAVHLTVTTVPASAIPASRRFPVGWKPRDQEYACLEVTDTGCGIHSQEIDKIVDPFFTNKLVGRGLGLPVVLGILHAHSGGLVVESRRGRDSGSVFRVYLPVSAERAARVSRPAKAEEPDDTRWSGTVLVADDEDRLLEAAKTSLARLGFSVIGVRNGLEAMDALRRYPHIRLVLCDLTMPHMDGWETLAALRRLSPRIPVILSSGYDEAHVMAEDRDEQPQAFLAKPYSLAALRRAIGRALRSRKA